ncbi:leucine-rich repeat protein [bacterium]|nr:leucine-rich repeat protein [bacterium]
MNRVASLIILLFSLILALQGCFSIDNTTYISSNTIDTSGNEIFSYSVQFEVGGEIIERQTIEEENKVREPSIPTKEGYTFIGWFNNNTKWNFSTDEITSDTTLVAKYEINKYLLTIKLNNGDEDIALNKEYNSRIELPTNIEKDGYVFSGYDINVPGVMPANNITINYLWERKATTIKFYDYNGSLFYETVSPNIIEYDSLAPIPERECTDSIQYEFSYWKMITSEEYLVEYKAVYNKSTVGLVFHDLEDDNTKSFVESYNGLSKEVIIPGEWQGKKVVKIGRSAFVRNSTITNVIIQNNIEMIDAFSFCECTSLSNIDLPDTLISIGDNAFGSCAISEITLPNNLKHIGDYVFVSCANLDNVILPTSLESLGGGVFEDCVSLSNISLPDSLETIQYATFKSCINLGTITLPNKLKAIESNVFDDCINLTNIVLPESLEEIGISAFNNCAKMENIFIPKNVSMIQTVGAFSSFCGCNPKTVVVDKENSIFDSRDNCNAIVNTSTNTLIYGCSSTIIPESVEKIGQYAFYCSSLTSITIPSNIESIGKGAFFSCKNLKSVIIEANIELISSNMFESCLSLESIVIPNSVKKIDSQAFRFCTQLKTITLSDNLIEIGIMSFADCESLEDIDLPDSLETMGYRTFMNCINLKEIIIPKNMTNIVSKSDSYTNILYGCLNIERIIVDEDNPKYDSRNNCNAIIDTTSGTLISGCKNSIISSGIKKIGLYAFAYINIETLNFATDCNLEEIGNYAFYESKIKSITLPNSVKKIGKESFSYCKNLEIVTLNDGLQELGDNCFSNTSIKSIFITKSVTTIGNGVFSFCNNLTTITIDEQNNYFLSANNHNAIITCNSSSNELDRLIAVCKSTIINNTIPVSGFKVIDMWSFPGLNEIEEIIIPDGVTMIEETFGYCDNLKLIILPKTIERLTYNLRSDSKNCKVFSLCTKNEWDEKNVIYENYYSNLPVALESEIYFYSEEKPEIEGRFWHYVENVPIVWEK